MPYIKPSDLPGDLKSRNGDKFKYSSYWRTWSRILVPMRNPLGIGQVEVDLTALNPSYPQEWQRVVVLRIREHRTDLWGDDCERDTLPHATLASMQHNMPPDIIERLLHEDLMPLIDYQKFRKMNNGGAPLADIMKVTA